MVCLQVLFISHEIFLSKIKLGNKFLFGDMNFPESNNSSSNIWTFSIISQKDSPCSLFCHFHNRTTKLKDRTIKAFQWLLGGQWPLCNIHCRPRSCWNTETLLGNFPHPTSPLAPCTPHSETLIRSPLWPWNVVGARNTPVSCTELTLPLATL